MGWQTEVCKYTDTVAQVNSCSLQSCSSIVSWIFSWLCFCRDSLWKFFLPADYQPMKVSDVPTPGKPRQILAFELRMNIIADATIDLLFTKNRVRLLLFPVFVPLCFRESHCLFILFVFTGDKCRSCQCWCRFIFGGQHSYDCRRKWYILNLLFIFCLAR